MLLFFCFCSFFFFPTSADVGDKNLTGPLLVDDDQEKLRNLIADGSIKLIDPDELLLGRKIGTYRLIYNY